MIKLTRLNGSQFLVNSDLIERVDETPDTVITLVDGTRYLVTEDLDTILDAIRLHRAAILSTANRISVEPREGPDDGPDLKVVRLDRES